MKLHLAANPSWLKTARCYRETMAALVIAFAALPLHWFGAAEPADPPATIIRIRGIAFDTFLTSSSRLCPAGTQLSSMLGRNDKAIYEHELSALRRQSNGRIPFDAELVISPNNDHPGGPPAGVEPRMIFSRGKVPVKTDWDLEVFVPKAAFPYLRAALLRARACQAANHRSGSAAHNAVMKVGVYLFP